MQEYFTKKFVITKLRTIMKNNIELGSLYYYVFTPEDDTVSV
jgi:hypothetical protein